MRHREVTTAASKPTNPAVMPAPVMPRLDRGIQCQGVMPAQAGIHYASGAECTRAKPGE